MAKIFRLHKEGNNNIVDWQVTAKYGATVINKIIDPDGETATKEITSIPSPFSRMDLAKTAFKFVADRDIDGDTIYHKIVSDCLDVGEIFFNADKFKDPHDRSKDKVEIIVWDREKQLAALKRSSSVEHNILGDSLEMYLKQDAQAYNFEKMDRIYLLNYKGPDRPAQMNIIGATSPATLFFSSANDLSYVSPYLNFSTNDRPFDSEYAPLYTRDFEYQRYIYALRVSYGLKSFATAFPELNDYLDTSYRFLDDAKKSIIDALDENSINAFEVLSDGANNDVEVLGIKMRKRPDIMGDITSDFEIASTIYSGRKPLVLPVEAGNKYTTLLYVQDSWSDSYKAPYSDRMAIAERTLPFTGDKYPYVTIGDFLQRNIISIPYKLNNQCFFDGNISVKNKTYLLPLTETFFDFFTVRELMGQMADGKNLIEMMPLAGGGVDVTLRIPIKNSKYITYSRQYLPNNELADDDNAGNVIEKRFGLGIFPLLDFGNIIKPYYRIAFFGKSNNNKLCFAGAAKDCKVQSHIVRREAGVVCSIETYVVEENFDRIIASIDAVQNVIVPRFRKPGNASEYTFAVDFGTTNTHIEYSIDGSSSSYAFDMKREETQMQRMSDDYGADKDIQFAFDDAFIPASITPGSDYSYPMRTAFAEYANIDYKKPTYCLADGNIPFRYEKAVIPSYHKVKTDLKWSNADDKRIRLYIENLFLLMRNKVLLNGGNLTATKIVWFYPVSMTKARCDQFSSLWKELYVQYFGGDIERNLIRISESIAPYNYYKQKKGAKSNVVTIDIGGGTTDVYVVENNVPSMLSSFRFASNSIFGDGYNWSPENNGFVNTFKGEIFSILKSNDGVKDIMDAFAAIEKSESSNDIVAFFFSLANNKIIREKNIPIDFMEMLAKNEKMKYVFIIFYGAILYYVANMMHAKGLALPQTLAFSGNGSKTLTVLSKEKDALTAFAALIFEKVYGVKYGENRLDIIMEDEPKLATCKGGIAHKSDLSFSEVAGIRTSLLGIDNQTYADDFKYDMIDSVKIHQVAESAAGFIDALFAIHDDNEKFFVNYLGADAGVIPTVKKICKGDLVEFTTQGLERKKEELKNWGDDASADVEETLFFYPIVAVLNNLASQIAQIK